MENDIPCMHDETIQTLIASRLEDIADQCEYLASSGNVEEARFLQEEGLALASWYDVGNSLMYLPDYTQQQ
jgi:hypothetical protein